ncbi:MAG TPA: 2TM domain-containing protein [Marmoricola sp.]|nr:2TM domain-containing protein [Marmoricola sp.]
MTTQSTQPKSLYEQAKARAMRKRKFRGDLMGYLVINAFLVGIWAVSGFGYFWPAWVMAIWGVFLFLDAWEVFYRREVTEEDIQREMHRLS